ncbi:hypothetical protein B0T17DRAFT_342120 [Bombardia bombarda]|uniref:Secreted protein n=1 Tax=Bombardia bombarda TaxID=252184 RepID=A0AA39WN87_9PEZI|nr:hypothetical protein B0T17DRAFT_342120 [Bombardia bombarda]
MPAFTFLELLWLLLYPWLLNHVALDLMAHHKLIPWRSFLCRCRHAARTTSQDFTTTRLWPCIVHHLDIIKAPTHL